METKQKQLIQFIKKNGGFAKYAELIKAGFYKTVISEVINAGQIERISRGIYCLAKIPDVSYPDFITASLIIPKGVICLITALLFYEVTDEIPRYIDIAVPTGSKVRSIQNIPLKVYRFSPQTWKQGVEEHSIDGKKIKIYSLAKTLADCFKFRNQIGMNIVRPALKTALEQKKVNHRDIMKYAAMCRVTNIIKPILEALI
ncbi:MAG: type IV toxin-antitoxin system AbiEi family antitoxin domain-containing protein [Candidatus Omnitrophica bacterium]|nr:type IV toxin-antitoxin system AbiEi family antitoxin domain-containing protein [Candidatus Omnitrophota bacterium]